MFELRHNVDEFIAELRLQQAGVLNAIRFHYKNWVLAIHTDIVRLTPQWGGNLAANWYLDIGSPHSSAQELGDPTVRAFGSSPRKEANQTVGRAPYSRGRDPAVALSLARQQGFWLDYVDRVFIHNPVEYADEVETDTGPRPIRAINRVPRAETGKVAMVYHAYVKYSMTGSALL